jgi:hypothetical protein
MIPTYDVFKITDGKPQWLSSASTLAEAREKAKVADGDQEFVILNQETQEKVSISGQGPRRDNP